MSSSSNQAEEQRFEKNAGIEIDKGQNLDKLKESAAAHVKLSCRVCHGRGVVEKSFPTAALGHTVIYHDHCQCVKNNLSRPKRSKNWLNKKIEVFTLGITPINIERSQLTKVFNGR